MNKVKRGLIAVVLLSSIILSGCKDEKTKAREACYAQLGTGTNVSDCLRAVEARFAD